MVDREKVMKGLRCLSNPYIQDMDERDCENCQYDNSCCFLDVTADALSLLKAQEPRVMTYDEMMKAEICFLEVKEIEEINPYIRFEVDDKSYWSSPYTNNEDNPFELLAEQEEYLINARCWTARPTDEQRKATPWAETQKEEERE